jgi:hypothetical protein
MARRYFGLGTAEWDNLLWWERALYLEGFEQEGLVSDGDAPQQDGSPDPGTTRVHDIGNNVGDAARLGFKEVTLDTSTGEVRRVGRPRT